MIKVTLKSFLNKTYIGDPALKKSEIFKLITILSNGDNRSTAVCERLFDRIVSDNIIEHRGEFKVFFISELITIEDKLEEDRELYLKEIKTLLS